MMRVLILTEDFSIGGAQRMIYELAKYVDSERVTLQILCYQKRVGTALADAVERIADVRYLEIEGHLTLRAFKKVFQAIRAFDPDIVHAHLTGQVFAIPWSLLYKKPVLVTAHTRPDEAFIRKTRVLLRWGLHHGHIYVAGVSQENTDMLRQYFLGTKTSGVNNRLADKLRCINNGVDFALYKKESHSAFTFINVSSLNANKNQIAIIRALKRLVEEMAENNYNKDDSEACRDSKDHVSICLLLVGDGETRAALQEEIQAHSLDSYVELVGSVGDVENYYARSDVYVQASFNEAMPMSVLEAMATGLPIIATNVGGLKDVVKDNGCLIKAGDDEALYLAMKRLYELYTTYEKAFTRMGELSRDYVRAYSSEEMARAYVGYYEAMLQQADLP